MTSPDRNRFSVFDQFATQDRRTAVDSAAEHILREIYRRSADLTRYTQLTGIKEVSPHPHPDAHFLAIGILADLGYIRSVTGELWQITASGKEIFDTHFRREGEYFSAIDQLAQKHRRKEVPSRLLPQETR